MSFMGLVACGSATTSNGGDGGNTMSGNDGGMVVSGDGSTGNPNGGPITFPAMCPALSACGGNVVGTWDYTAGCIADPFADLKQACPTLMVTDQKGTVKGTVTFTAGNVTRTGTADYTGTVVLPPTCTQGVPCATFSMKGATCTGTSTCTCAVSRTESFADVDTYSVVGNKIVTGGGNEYDYCVMGSKNTYTEIGASPEHPGVFEMTKR